MGTIHESSVHSSWPANAVNVDTNAAPALCAADRRVASMSDASCTTAARSLRVNQPQLIAWACVVGNMFGYPTTTTLDLGEGARIDL